MPKHKPQKWDGIHIGDLVILDWFDTVGGRCAVEDMPVAPGDELLHLENVGWVDSWDEQAIRIRTERPVDNRGHCERTVIPWAVVGSMRVVETT